MITNWAYLVLNNMTWWKQYLDGSANSIRIKLQNLNYVNWRQFHPKATVVNGVTVGFNYALFIDNTMDAFCRPAGNILGGPAAPRTPPVLSYFIYTCFLNQ